MCLGIPMKVESVDGAQALIHSGGLKRTINISLLGSVKKGDYVIVHAGFAIEKVKPHEAQKTLKLAREVEDAAGM